MSNGILSAVVYGGAPPLTYAWSNGATTQTINNINTGYYTVTVSDHYGCTATTSPFLPLASIPQPFICMVTVDSLSQYNVIMWDKTSYNYTDTFIVCREITTNNYLRIGTVPYDSLSEFIDTVRTKYFPNTGDPNAGTYRYKIKVNDSCGTDSTGSTFSPYHNTIFMTNNNGNFSWQFYTIEN